MAKRYKVRKGYSWIGPDGKNTGAKEVLDTDPGFKGQRHKLVPVEEPKPAAPATPATPATPAAPAPAQPAAPAKSPDDRQVQGKDVEGR